MLVAKMRGAQPRRKNIPSANPWVRCSAERSCVTSPIIMFQSLLSTNTVMKEKVWCSLSVEYNIINGCMNLRTILVASNGLFGLNG